MPSQFRRLPAKQTRFSQLLKTPTFKENVDLLGRRLGIPIEFSERRR